MSYSISTLKNDLEAMLHGTSLDSIQNVDNLIDRAGRQLLLDIDPAETIRKAQIQGQVYDGVFDYSAPTDLKGNKVIDIRPQVNRDSNDNFSQRRIEDFDLRKSDNTFNVMYNSGTKSLRLSKSLTSGVILNEMDSLTANGTWSAGGDATGLVVDDINYVSGSGSLRFNLDGSTTAGRIENSDFTAVDLSDEEDIGALFLWVYIPDTSVMTSVDLRWGDDTSNYWNKTVTTTHEGLSFQTGWNLLRFDWSTATETGSPDSSGVNYSRITINYDGTATNEFRVDKLIARIGQIWEIVYYSKYIFSSSGGTFQETVDDDTNLVNLDTESYNLLTFKCAEYAAMQQEDTNSSFDSTVFRREYELGRRKYMADNKNQTQKQQSSYYSIARTRSNSNSN